MIHKKLKIISSWVHRTRGQGQLKGLPAGFLLRLKKNLLASDVTSYRNMNAERKSGVPGQ